MPNWKRILLLGLVVTTALAMSMTSTAFADEGTPPPHAGGRLERAAELLGMTVEELQAALESGLTIRQLAEEAGITLEDVRPRLANRLEQAAELLGMTVEELQAALESGLTIRHLAEEAGITLEDVRPRLANRLEQAAELLGM
ncbi:MAG: hypothetical protein JXA97_13415, partial [Anaerolineales bacterium]|nr:hypothetical protein [Anaerolineales bacterium]